MPFAPRRPTARPIELPAAARRTLQLALSLSDLEARAAAVAAVATATHGVSAQLEQCAAAQAARLARTQAARDPLFGMVWAALQDARAQDRPIRFV